MDTKLTLLGLLEAGSGYGYDLKNSWDRWFSETKPLAFGQVYGTLSRLARDGMIEAIGAEPGAGPERKRYAITDQGQAAVSEWMFTPEIPAASIQAELFAKTVIALMLGLNADRLLDLQRSEHVSRMRELTKKKQGGDLSTILLADYAMFHIEADLRWIDLAAARLTELRAEVLA